MVGPSGQLLDATLEDVGWSRDKTYVSNVVLCRPPSSSGADAPPNGGAIASCYPRLVREIASVRPKIVVAVGATTAQTLLRTRDGIGKVQGVCQWSEELQTYVMATYHPAAVLHGINAMTRDGASGGTGFFDDIHSDLTRAVRMVNGLMPLPRKRYEIDWAFLRTPEKINGMLERLLHRAGEVDLDCSIDTESISPYPQVRPIDDRFIMFQISIGPRDGETKFTYSCAVVDGIDYTLFRRVLRHPRIRWIMHNAKHDQQVLHAWVGCAARNVECTMALMVCLHERTEQTGLEFAGRTYLNAPYYKGDLGMHGYSYARGPQNAEQWWDLAKYGALDAFNTRELWLVLPALVREEGAWGLYERLLLPAQKGFAQTESHGTGIDVPYAHELEALWRPEVDKALSELRVYAKAQGFPRDPRLVQSNEPDASTCPECCPPDWRPTGPRKTWREQYPNDQVSCRRCMKRRFVLIPNTELNPRSPQQLQHLFFDILHLPQPDGRRTSDASFQELNEHVEVVKLLKNLREKDHLLSAYVLGILDDVWKDGRLHPDTMINATRNGRLAIHNPPLQTLPKWINDPRLAKMVRKLFIPTSDEYVIAEFDYRTLELFTAAILTEDPQLMYDLTTPPPGYDKPDVHRVGAAEIFRKSLQEVTGFDRFNYKFVIFGIAYGRGAYSLANGELAGITGGNERQAQAYIDRVWGRYHVWKEAYDRWQHDALTKGVLVTPFGRRRRWRLITPALEKGIRNQATNFPPASTASDICLSATTRLAPELPRRGLGNVLFTVHDAVVAQLRKDRLAEAVHYVISQMEIVPFPTPVKLQVEVEIGPSLGEVVEWKE
jgi:uracil-DNA glycosylase family 4